MGKFFKWKVFEELNVGFVLDEGQASVYEEFRGVLCGYVAVESDD